MVTFRSGADGVVGSTAQEGQSLAQEVQQLRQALASQPLIEQAKGMLMAQHGCTADEAFDMLREASMRANRKLRDLAAAIVQSSTDGRSDPSQDRRHLRCRLVPNDPDRVAAADRRDQQAAAREAALGRREARVADLNEGNKGNDTIDSESACTYASIAPSLLVPGAPAERGPTIHGRPTSAITGAR